jgi:hypothetical protein
MERLRSFAGFSRARLGVVVVAVSVAAACSPGAPGGGGGGGGGANADKALAEVQALFGTPMTAGSWEGETLSITLAKDTTKAMAKLFCPRVRDILVTDGLTAKFRMVEDQTGTELATEATCPKT